MGGGIDQEIRRDSGVYREGCWGLGGFNRIGRTSGSLGGLNGSGGLV